MCALVSCCLTLHFVALCGVVLFMTFCIVCAVEFVIWCGTITSPPLLIPSNYTASCLSSPCLPASFLLFLFLLFFFLPHSPLLPILSLPLLSHYIHFPTQTRWLTLISGQVCISIITSIKQRIRKMLETPLLLLLFLSRK